MPNSTALGAGPSRLHTFSLVYERMMTLRGETAFIDAALAQSDGIVAHRIAADDLLPYDGLTEEPDCDEPFADLLDLSRDQAILDQAAAVGVQTLLTGHGGDDVFEIPPFHISELLRAGKFRAAWSEANAWSRGFSGDPWHVLHRYGLAHLLPVRFRGGLRSPSFAAGESTGSIRQTARSRRGLRDPLPANTTSTSAVWCSFAAFMRPAGPSGCRWPWPQCNPMSGMRAAGRWPCREASRSRIR